MDYSEDIAAALEEIQDSGEDCLFYLPPVQRDAAKPWEDADEDEDEPATQEIEATGFVTWLPVGRVGFEGITRGVTKGNEIPEGYQIGFVGNTPVVNPKWYCKRNDGSEWAIRNIDPLNPNGQLILQTVLFQKMTP